MATILLIIVGCEADRVSSEQQPTTSGPNRNLILISIDTLRPDHLGAYGYRRRTSPALDSLAAAGVLVEDVISTSPWTLPSHGSILTGTYPATHGLRALGTAIDAEQPTLAEILRENGFHTAAVTNSTYFAPRYGMRRGFEYFHSELEDHSQTLPSNVVPIAMQWLRERRPGPFFLFLHLYDVHSDYSSLPRFEKKFSRPYRGYFDGSTDQLVAVQDDGHPITRRDARHLIDLYDAGIRQVDFVLGKFLDFLEEQGLLESTIIIVTSDHGEEFLERGSVLHGSSMYEELLRVPLIVRGPNVPKAKRITEPASIVDITPTALSLLKVESDVDFDGIDLTTIWSSSEVNPRPLFGEADHRAPTSDKLQAVRFGSFKLHRDTLNGSVRLFDLATDQGERTDISSDRPDLVETLAEKLDEHLAERTVTRAQGELSAEQIERLRSLGYVVP